VFSKSCYYWLWLPFVSNSDSRANMSPDLNISVMPVSCLFQSSESYFTHIQNGPFADLSNL
jgi:hypothetical protein